MPDHHEPTSMAALPATATGHVTQSAQVDAPRPSRWRRFCNKLRRVGHWLCDPARIARLAALAGIALGLAGACTGIGALTALGPSLAIASTIAGLIIDWWRDHDHHNKS